MKPVERCPACGSARLVHRGHAPDVEGRVAEPFDLLRCSECGLTCASPMLDDEELAPYYDAQFYGSFGSVGSILQKTFLSWRAARVAAIAGPPARVLDVGCGDGPFLAAMRERGYAVVGVEPSAAGRAQAAARGLDVHAALDGIAPGSVDVATLWQVLEHVAEPRPFLAKLRSALRPGGAVLVSVPNFGSLEARAFGDRWFHLDVPRHVLHFDRHSLRGLLERAGFHVENESTRSLEYNVFGLVQSAWNAAPSTTTNAFYRVVKRGAPLRSFDTVTRANVVAALATLPGVAAAAGVAGLVAEAAGRGATLTVVAR